MGECNELHKALWMLKAQNHQMHHLRYSHVWHDFRLGVWTELTPDKVLKLQFCVDRDGNENACLSDSQRVIVHRPHTLSESQDLHYDGKI